MNEIDNLDQEYLRLAIYCLLEYCQNNKEERIHIDSLREYYPKVLDKHKHSHNYNQFSRIKSNLKTKYDRIILPLNKIGLHYDLDSLTFTISDKFFDLAKTYREAPVKEIEDKKEEVKIVEKKSEPKQINAEPSDMKPVKEVKQQVIEENDIDFEIKQLKERVRLLEKDVSSLMGKWFKENPDSPLKNNRQIVNNM